MEKSIRDKYQAVIGLEVHAQMNTMTKAYSNDINQYGSKPNTNVSIVSLGHPGTLPRFNKKVVEFGIRLGVACHSDIRRDMYFARKNYFYPDLPKGYQITQDLTPICNNGYVEIKTEEGPRKKIGLTRIHMEEDAGKSMHDVDPFNTLVDLNRAGVPLLEIVSEPDIRTSDEAYEYVTEVRKLVRYLDICDGNMEEGSLRCDANISVMLKDAPEFGTKVEVKNMNSIRNVQKAIEFEITRQIEEVEKGNTIYMETRSFDAARNITVSMRSKEAANDYRFFPEPDILPLTITQEDIDEIKKNLPPLPNALFDKYTKEFGLTDYDAGNITESKSIALFFEEILESTKHFKPVANILMGDIKSYLNANGLEIENFPISAKTIAAYVELIQSGAVNNSAASQSLFPALLKEPTADVKTLAEKLNIIQDGGEDEIIAIAQGVLDAHPDETARYRGGDKKLTGFFMGKFMAAAKGKADPKTGSQILRKLLDQ
jgi:aspartyl-tRNA(Asn)/glutamyl-tRNA(Gln) amidotransferase subunit B